MRRTMFPTASLVLAMHAALGCSHDASHLPAYAPYVGETVYLKEDFVVVRKGLLRRRYEVVPVAESAPTNRRIVTQAPAGTTVKVESLRRRKMGLFGFYRDIATVALPNPEHPADGLHARLTVWEGLSAFDALAAEKGRSPTNNAAIQFVEGDSTRAYDAEDPQDALAMALFLQSVNKSALSEEAQAELFWGAVLQTATKPALPWSLEPVTVEAKSGLLPVEHITEAPTDENSDND